MIKSSLWLIVHKYYFLFLLSFLPELGSGRAAEEEEEVEGAGRLWALAPEGPDASSAARGWTAFSMAWLQRWSSSWN